MIVSQSLFTFFIVLGIVGGIGSLTTLVALLIVEKDHEYLGMEKKKNELEYLLKEAQISHLASQMQPHFLFNSLNTVSSLVRLDKNKDAIQSIQAISSLLRYTLRDTQQLVTLEEELENVQMYLQIQKFRFGKRLEWKIEMDDSCRTSKVPMLSIQPLVENACKYGIEPKISGGFIHIIVEKLENQIIIRIYDNGIGISDQAMEQFYRLKKHGVSSDVLGIGIVNTYGRIKHFFGDLSDLQIISTSQGTTCSIILQNGESK